MERPDGRIGRGLQTRERLLNAAAKLFSARGFEAVSTRELAAEAGTTLPSIAHHFGSKEGLQAALLERIAASMKGRLAPSLAAASDAVGSKRRDHVRVQAALEGLVDAFATALLEEPDDWSRVMLLRPQRPAMPIDSPSITEVFLLPLAACLRALAPAKTDETSIRMEALALVGSLLLYRGLRPVTLEFLNWTGFGDAQIATIGAFARGQARALGQRLSKPRTSATKPDASTIGAQRAKSARPR